MADTLICVGGINDKFLFLVESKSLMDGYIAYLLQERNGEEIGVIKQDHVWLKKDKVCS